MLLGCFWNTLLSWRSAANMSFEMGFVVLAKKKKYNRSKGSCCHGFQRWQQLSLPVRIQSRGTVVSVLGTENYPSTFRFIKSEEKGVNQPCGTVGISNPINDWSCPYEIRFHSSGSWRVVVLCSSGWEWSQTGSFLSHVLNIGRQLCKGICPRRILAL